MMTISVIPLARTQLLAAMASWEWRFRQAATSAYFGGKCSGNENGDGKNLGNEMNDKGEENESKIIDTRHKHENGMSRRREIEVVVCGRDTDEVDISRSIDVE